MARWGEGKIYGDGTLWGSTSAQDTNLLWAVEIDWDGDGAFSGYNEASRCISFRSRRGRDYLVASDGEGFERQMVGEATMTLTNDDGRYDPFNTAGLYYPNIRPGRYARAYVVDGIGGTQYNIIAGRVSDIRPYRRNNHRYVDLTIRDGWQWLADYDAFISLQEDLTVGAAVAQVLTAVSYPSIWGTDVSAAGDAIPYWWEDKRGADAVLHDLIYNYEMGLGTVAADGKFTFIHRMYSDTDCETITQDLILKDIGSPMPWETVRNVARVVVNPRVESTGVVLWTMGGTPTVKAGATLETFADFRYDNNVVPAKNLITPAATTDYTAVGVNSTGGATTDNVTADLTCAIDYNYGLSAKLIWTNSGSSDLIIDFAQLRGDAIASPYQTTMEEDEAGTDQPRILKLDTQYMQDINQGEGAVLHLARWLSPVQEFPEVYIEARPALQFLPDLQCRIGFTAAALGIDTSYRVGAIEHEWLSETGQATRTMFRLEPLPDMSGLWRFDAQFTTDADAGYYPTIFGY